MLISCARVLQTKHYNYTLGKADDNLVCVVVIESLFILLAVRGGVGCLRHCFAALAPFIVAKAYYSSVIYYSRDRRLVFYR